MNLKLIEFIKRNQKRNAALYLPECVEDIDYVMCPVSGQRLSMIKKSYIERVLGLTVSEYDKKYPGIRKVSQRRKENIKSGLKEIDAETGLTKYEIGQIKARIVLSTADDSGITGYEKKGKKTRATHMKNIDKYGRNGYRRQADARLTTILPNGLTVEQNAHNKQKETLLRKKKTGTGGASKLSKKILKPIIDYLDENKIEFYFDLNEYGIKDTDTGLYYFYDLTIPKFNVVVEYQSTAWHADPTLPLSEWDSWKPPRGSPKTAKEVLEYDFDKAKSIYKHRGFCVYFVWQRTQEKDVNDILCLLKTLNTKY